MLKDLGRNNLRYTAAVSTDRIRVLVGEVDPSEPFHAAHLSHVIYQGLASYMSGGRSPRSTWRRGMGLQAWGLLVCRESTRQFSRSSTCSDQSRRKKGGSR